jgi:hypothetical protein
LINQCCSKLGMSNVLDVGEPKQQCDQHERQSCRPNANQQWRAAQAATSYF